ncbi:hypothetical protein HBA55_32765 [Pseudomaricurvus alkylphenolicus]|uniref:hypothetical protein n=1 Tax=Pseudomaricurvus alkylphenolicus TaxID=1306991 RepID=UPI00141D9ADC|nr:hypothetical protein [Pseudomaricurvus alkylphenolicus]NIB44413.1 hypothetical protein [Pseudomaricurvus alkylphenolicus]
MSDIHIDDFYKDVARMLVQLYRQFPRKSLLLVEEISGPDTPDEYGLHSERHQSCFGAAIWLAESGYIRYGETIRQEGLDQVILTHMGFTLLSGSADPLPDGEEATENPQLPASVAASRRTNIHLLRAVLRSGESVTINRMVQQLLRQSLDYRYA